MSITPELLIAFGGVLTGILSFIGAQMALKKVAKKDEVQLLRDEVTRLQSDKEKLDLECQKWRANFSDVFNQLLELRKENVLLKSAILILKAALKSKGIDIPLIDLGTISLEDTLSDKDEHA